MATLEQVRDVILNDAVDAALREASRAGLPICAGCLSRWLARRLVIELLPLLYADYEQREPRARITGAQYAAMVMEAGRSAAHVRCWQR